MIYLEQQNIILLKRDDVMQSSKEKLIQNLIDCNCDDKIINEFMKAFDDKNKPRALLILAEHRQKLLDEFHKCDCCISCLDYLVNRIERED